jgi:Cd(II)/Pb(II)-responsive transcriptional regulator
MRIGELSRTSGVDVETIRYYEKAGLLPSPDRQANGYRDYGAEQVEQLAFIRHCRALDMPLADVARLLGFLQGAPTDCNDINHLVDEHLARIRARIESMHALEKRLMALRGRCAQGRKTPECGILHELAGVTETNS